MSATQSSTLTMVGDVCVASQFVDLFTTHGLTSLSALLNHCVATSMGKPGLPPWRERLRLELNDADGSAKILFLKRYRSPPARAQCHRIIEGSPRHSTAWIEWYWVNRLMRDGVATMLPVAFAESMHRGCERASVIVTEAVPGQSLESWAHGRQKQCDIAGISALARFIRRFHAMGYVHRDLYLSHVFYDDRHAGEECFRLIDLQRLMRPRLWRSRWVVKDLASLNYSCPERVASSSARLRFLRAYMGVDRIGSGHRRMIRRIIAKTRRIARHDERRNRRHAADRIRQPKVLP